VALNGGPMTSDLQGIPQDAPSWVRATTVEDASAIERRIRRQRSPGDLGLSVLRPRVARHHRRRRATALAVLAALGLIGGLVAGSGSGSSGHSQHVPQTGYFGALSALGGAGPHSFASEERDDESAAITRTLGYTPFVRVAGSQHRELALTFDDGPGPYTPEVLAILRRMHVPATFFEVGVLEQYFHASTTEIVAMGDPIGDHTQLHPPMSELSPADQRSEILEDAAAIGRYGAPFPRLFRPPYGLWNNTTLALLRKYRMLMVLWTVDTNDYQKPGAGAIVDSAVDGARPGAIILMHDAGGDRSETVAALPTVVRDLRRKGYKLVTVPRLLLDNPAPRDQQYTPGALGGGG
jgi:peptidoglycan/xylan/chitin deacetylase (PgdA/CDA1 family)